MKLHKYKNYSEYVKVQKAGYEQKKSLIWASKPNIKNICDNILSAKYIANEYGRGICHGVRTGKEIEWFLEYLPGWEIIGTEIGESKNDHIYRWDFNKVNTTWLGVFDFIYTNAFDHVYKPEETLAVWREQLRLGGIVIIEHSSGHERATKLDPLGATVDDMKSLMINAKLKDISILRMPHIKQKYEYQCAVYGVK